MTKTVSEEWTAAIRPYAAYFGLCPRFNNSLTHEIITIPKTLPPKDGFLGIRHLIVNMNALKTRFLRSPALSTIPIPQPEPGELLIKVAYVSLNPTDCT